MASRSTTSRNLLRIAAIFAALIVFPTPFAAGDDPRFIAGLRERRLFTLAEDFCRDRLGDPSLNEIDRAELVVELVSTQALHSLHAPPAERAAIWKAVDDEVTAFSRRRPPSPRQVLVDVQGALAALAKAELARQEVDAGPVAPPALAAAQADLRAAIKQLQALREEAARLLRIRNRQPASDPAELSANDLLGVQQHLQFQLGRAWRSLGESFAVDSPDWISALQQAVAELKPLADSASEHPLAWQAMLDDVVCRRLLKDKGASDRLTSLRGANPPPRIQLAALGEGIRLAMATGDFELAEKWSEEGQKLAAISAEFDLARLELQLAKASDGAKRKDEPAARAAQEAAAKIAAEIHAKHGSLWSRRGQALLAAIAGSGPSNVDILAAAAAQHLRFGRLPEAIGAYDQAAAQAKSAGNNDRAFSFGWAAAAIEYQQQHWPAAQVRFLKLAADFAQHPQASEAHWNGATCAALIAKAKSPPLLDPYLALLEDHLVKWPSGGTADKARWWLGQSRQSQRRWSDAARAFAGISPDFAEYPVAIRRWGECVENQLQEDQAAAKLAADAPAKVIAELERRYVAGDGKLPVKWDAAQSEAAIAAARLRLRWMPNSAEETARQLGALVRASPEGPGSQAARRWLVVALAAAGKSDEAMLQLESLKEATPPEWLSILRQIAATSRAAPIASQKSLASVRLAIVARLQAGISMLSVAEQLIVRREKVDALLAVGRRAEGLAALETLAKSLPDDGALQQQLAEALDSAEDIASIEKSLAQWRLIVSRSPARSERWYQASLGVATSLYRLGKKSDSRQSIEILMARPPGLEKTPLKKDFLELLRKCSG